MNKKRKLRKWVRVTLAVVKAAATVCVCLFLFACLLSAWTDAHYQQLEKYSEIAVCEVNR